MFIKPKLVLLILAMLFFISNMAHAEDSMEKEETVETAPAPNDQPEEEASDEMEDDNQLQEESKIDDEVQDSESPEMNAVKQSSNEVPDKRALRIPCKCWIGWVKKKHLKYKYFGTIRTFKWYAIRKHSKCSASCSKKCAPWLRKKAFLCKKIGKKYHYKWHKVGCFSLVGWYDLPSNLWDFDGSPHGLCCKKKKKKSCNSVYGAGFFYHSGMKLCVKYLLTGPIPGVPNGYLKPPFCYYKYKLYACQRPKYITKPVPCW